MKRVLILILLSVSVVFAQDVKLPKPNAKDTFIQLLNKRTSSRDFTGKKQIDNKTLSDLLYSAVGQSRKDGKLVIPTGKGTKNIDVYVIKKDGAYLYNKTQHNLSKLTDENLFSYFAKQPFIDNVSVILLYTGIESGDDNDFLSMHAGSAYQNVGIYCAEHNIKNVVRGYFDKDGIKSALKLDKNVKVIISQAIGY